ncbi:MAG: hypothetical protein ACM3W4_10830, partial [Ignavibacteriales bacterium]
AAMASLLLAACHPMGAPPDRMADPDAAACRARGGSIQAVGMMGLPTCVTPYPDAGRACTDKSDCQGACLLEGGDTVPPAGPVRGHCQRNDALFGCYSRIEQGKIVEAICVD